MKNCCICNKETEDLSDLFCPKCLKKDWKIRFKAIRKLERQKKRSWKFSTSTKKPKKSYNKIYWERKKEERW